MATRTRSAAIAAFERPEDAQEAIRELRRQGFAEDDIGFMSHDAERRGRETGRTRETSKAEDTKVGQGAAAGAAVGGGAGALWSLGVAAGMLPAIGPVIAGGVLAAVIASAAGGAAVGGLAGALVGLGVPEDEAKRYEEEFERGRTIVSVRSPERYSEAHEILERHGGYTLE